MNNCKKTIKQSDISTTQIKLKYSSSYAFYSFEDYGISSKVGVNSPISISGSVPQSTLNFHSMRQLYGQNYLTGSVLNSGSSWDWNAQSTAYSGSSEYELRYFPTQSEAIVGIISSPPIVIGEQISRNTLVIKPETGNNYLIVDDGNGNLIDKNTSTHVGSVIYSQGIVLITNQDYSFAFYHNRLKIDIVNASIKASILSISLDNGAIGYAGGSFPVTRDTSTTIYPNSGNVSTIKPTIRFSSNGDWCVRCKHESRDQYGNLLATYNTDQQFTVPNPPFIGNPPVNVSPTLIYDGVIDENSYIKIILMNGTC